MQLNHGIVSAAVALLLTSLGPVNLCADVRLTGNEDKIVVHANNASVPEILREVQSLLHVRITLIGSTPRQFTGVYVGPLRQVLSRLLDGINYVVSSQPDGLTVAIISPSVPRSIPIGANTPSATGNTTIPATMIAANDTSGAVTPAPQGRMPAENPDKASIPAAPNAGASGGTIGQAQPVRVEANEPENNSGPQGWTPTEDPYKAFIPAAPKVGAPGATVDQAQPARAEVDEPENKSGVQGWTPTEDPYKAFKAATTPTRPAAMAAPPIPGFGAIGSVSALMNNMEGDPAPRAFYGRSDLNRQLRSSKVPPSLAPMLTPPPGLDN